MKHVIFGAAAGLLLALTGCTQSPGDAPAADTPSSPQMTVYKSPSCGCCGAWVDHLRNEGFAVDVIEQENLSPRKAELGVPARLGSCHTAVVDGYVVEGHVPAGDIRRLLAERPDATGLAVPGMPIGSPGMEMGERRDPYTVWLFQATGDTQTFAQHGDGGPDHGP